MMADIAEKAQEDSRGAARGAVVTGSSSGIGKAIAARLIADGWSVIGLDRTNDQSAESFRAALTAFLLSPKASAITGQQIVICGGSSL